MPRSKAPTPSGGSAATDAVRANGDSGLSTFVSAKIIGSGGRALKDAATFDAVITPQANKLKRASARSAPRAPEVYIAVGT